MTGTDIKNDLLIRLDDAGGIRWDNDTILLAINEAGRDIVTLKPKAASVRENFVLILNNCRQIIPADAVAVLDAYCNKGAGGATPGRAISIISEERLRASRPNYRSDVGLEVKHLLVDERDPGGFIVWPAVSAAQQIEILLQKHYVPIAALASTITLDDSYRNPMADYVAGALLAMEGEAQNIQLAMTYYQKYAAYMGVQVKKQKYASAPANSPESPVHPMTDKNGQ